MFPSLTSPKDTKLHSDRDLERLRANKKHARYEEMQDHFQNLCIMGMYLIPLIFILLSVVLVIHWIQLGQWSTLEKIVFGIGTYIVGYITHHLQSNGIQRE